MVKINWIKWFYDKGVGELLARNDFIRTHIWFGWYWEDYDCEMHYIMRWYRMKDPDNKYRSTIKSAKGITQ